MGVSGNIPSIQKIALRGTACIPGRVKAIQKLGRFQMSSLTYRAAVKLKIMIRKTDRIFQTRSN